MIRKISILFVISILLCGCQTRQDRELLSRIQNGDVVTYVYYENGQYVAYYFKDSVLIRKERID